MIKYLRILLFVLFNQNGNFFPSGGGGAGGGNPDPNPNPNPDPNPNPGDAISYPSDLEETYHGNDIIAKHWDKDKKQFRLGNMMRSLIHSTTAIGKAKMTLPDDSWTDAQWKDLHKKISQPSQ